MVFSNPTRRLAKMLVQAVTIILAIWAPLAHPFCFHAPGGVGEYHGTCSDSIDMEACYARCNCWSDFPDMGGHITHEMDAWCFQDACWCSYNQDGCPYGTLKTAPYCCTKQGITCDDVHCDTEGNCDTGIL